MYSPKTRKNKLVPWGFNLEDDGVTLTPIDEQLETLQRIKDLVDEKLLSIRDGAMYLTDLTGRYISHEGLRKRLILERQHEN